MRDPDGYYIEFCSCELLEDYLTDVMKKHEHIAKEDKWDVQMMSGVTKVAFLFYTLSKLITNIPKTRGFIDIFIPSYLIIITYNMFFMFFQCFSLPPN